MGKHVVLQLEIVTLPPYLSRRKGILSVSPLLSSQINKQRRRKLRLKKKKHSCHGKRNLSFRVLSATKVNWENAIFFSIDLQRMHPQCVPCSVNVCPCATYRSRAAFCVISFDESSSLLLSCGGTYLSEHLKKRKAVMGFLTHGSQAKSWEKDVGVIQTLEKPLWISPNGTLDAETKKRRPLFNSNIPQKWWITCLFYAFITFRWVLKSAYFWLFFGLFKRVKRRRMSQIFKICLKPTQKC